MNFVQKGNNILTILKLDLNASELDTQLSAGSVYNGIRIPGYHILKRKINRGLHYCIYSYV